MLVAVVTTGQITTGWRWLAVLIGLGVLALLWIFASITSGSWNPWRLIEGADGISSTSKFQWILWLTVILFAYVVLWVLRAKSGDYSAISNVPANLLTVLGFSTGTAVAAKGITVGYLRSGQVTKPTGAGAGSPVTKPTGAAAAPQKGGILQDDAGVPELAKIQMVGFTFVAVSIFVATLIHQITSTPPQTQLPDIDSALLVLMGLSQGGYLGKKLVSFGSPILYSVTPSKAAPNASVTIQGASLGASQGGNQLLLDGAPVAVTQPWADTALTFTVPASPPGGGAAWVKPEQIVRISVVINGQSSNDVTLVVASP
jgi:IPT/TIG domain.